MPCALCLPNKSTAVGLAAVAIAAGSLRSTAAVVPLRGCRGQVIGYCGANYPQIEVVFTRGRLA